MGKKKSDYKYTRKPKQPEECDLGSKYGILLLVLVGIGAGLRIFNLGYNSLWLDEASTYGIAVKSFWDIWGVTTGGEFNPPLFHWIEHFMLMLGNSEYILRFAPAIFGILAIPLVYFAGKEFMDRNTGIIAAAFMAFSPFAINYSQEARAYTMVLFFTLLAFIFWLRASKDGNIRDWILFGVFSALAFWTHFYALVFVGALVFYTLATRIREMIANPSTAKPVAAGILAFLITASPLILVTVQLYLIRSANAPTYGIQGLAIITETLRQLAGYNEMVYIFLTTIFVIGLAWLTVREGNENKGLLLIAVFALTFLISGIMSFKIPMIPRYLIFLSPLYFITIASLYEPAYRVANTKFCVYALMILGVLVAMPFLSTYYYGYSKDDWRGFTGRLIQTTQPGDIIAVAPGYIGAPLNYYYSNTSDQTMQYGANSGNDLQAIYGQKEGHSMYVVVTGDISAANPNGDAVRWLQANTAQIIQNTGIYLFKAR